MTNPPSKESPTWLSRVPSKVKYYTLAFMFTFMFGCTVGVAMVTEPSEVAEPVAEEVVPAPNPEPEPEPEPVPTPPPAPPEPTPNLDDAAAREQDLAVADGLVMTKHLLSLDPSDPYIVPTTFFIAAHCHDHFQGTSYKGTNESDARRFLRFQKACDDLLNLMAQ